MEFWNLVFTQFNNDGNDNYIELEHKNIDTGMGIERLACIMQEVDSGYQIDTMVTILNAVSAICGVKVGDSEKSDISMRIVAEHIRATVMLVCDGVIPSNEGRGYILRRLLRRAARHGRLLGIKGEFLTGLADAVFEINGGAYPELLVKADYIRRVIGLEEARFAKTIDSGLVRLNDMIAALKAGGVSEVSGEDAFRLYDTYGFPVDLTIEILNEQGMTLDRTAFDSEMEKQRTRARTARASRGELGWGDGGHTFAEGVTSEFIGYEYDSGAAKILAIAADGESADVIGEGMEGVIVLDKTPFYAESGGQVADFGTISADGAVFEVSDVRKTPDGKILHSGRVLSGGMTVGADVTAQIDVTRRAAIRRAHSSVHLLQAALRQVLGAHVEQAGSLVEPDRARFDFQHFSAMTDAEIAETERIVNEKILEGIAGITREMPIDEAKKLGAMALFGEKYGDTVRVVTFGDFSMELCGGTHLDNSAKVGLFKIVSEASVAAGVRRIEAVTGKAVLSLLASRESEIAEAAAALKTTVSDLPRRALQVSEEARVSAREIESLSGKLARLDAEKMLANAEEIGAVKLIALTLDGQTSAGLRTLCDTLRDMDESIVAVLGTVSDGKVAFAAGIGKAAVKAGAHAGNLLKAAAKVCGGGGGGRPDSATAGGRDTEKLAEAISGVKANLSAMLK
jgi:alanyl-tRNA synthetase